MYRPYRTIENFSSIPRSLPVLSILGQAHKPSKTYEQSKCPVYEYTTVKLLGGCWLDKKNALDDSGCDTGVAIDYDLLCRLLQRNTDIFYDDEINTASGLRRSVVVLGRVEIPNVGLDVFTTIAGVPGLGEKNMLIGRFMVGDLLTKVVAGSLSSKVLLRLDDKDLADDTVTARELNVGCTYTIAPCPSFKEALQRFSETTEGQRMLELVKLELKSSNDMFKKKDYQGCLHVLRRVLLYSFFVFDDGQKAKVMNNLINVLIEMEKYEEATERCKQWSQNHLNNPSTEDKTKSIFKKLEKRCASKKNTNSESS